MGTSPPSRGRCLNAGLILAAGAGTRYGERPKLLADLGGRPLLEQTISAQSAVTEIERIVVVLGAHADAVLAGCASSAPSRCAAPVGLSAARGALEDSPISERGPATGEAVDRGRRRNVA
jgi:CTP:molybdopterin cytidylyltransferase MocA